MPRPSRDSRESMPLSSRDQHFGQRIVSEQSLSHNPLWSQSFRISGGRVCFVGVAPANSIRRSESAVGHALFIDLRAADSCLSSGGAASKATAFMPLLMELAGWGVD